MWEADPRFRSSLLQTIATGLDAWQEPQIAAATIGENQISARLAARRPQHPVSDRPGGRPAPPARPVHRAGRRHHRRRVRALRPDRQADRPAAAARTRRGREHRAAAEPRRDRLDRPRAGRAAAHVLQNISQAADRWGRERAETIIANHRARLFCSGIGDRATLEYLRHTLGEEEIARISTHRQSALTPRLAHALNATSARSRPPTACASRPPTPRSSSTGASPPAWLRLRPWYQDATLSALAAGRPNPPACSRRRSRPLTRLLRLPARWAR